MKVSKKGLVLAIATAMLASGTVSSVFANEKDATAGTVKCDFKDKGIKMTASADECKKQGGTVVMENGKK